MLDPPIPPQPPWRPLPDRPPLPGVPSYPGVPPVRPTPPAPVPSPPPGRFLPFPVVEPAEHAGDLWDRLLARRIVLLAGHLDDATATRAAAQVMLLDADGDGEIQLQLSCPDGELDASVLLAETVQLLQAPVRAVAGGMLGGPVLAVYASAGRRLAHRHAAFVLREPRVRIEGNADQLTGGVAQHRHQLGFLHEQLARACGRDAADVAADLRAGRLLTATEAVDYGLVHELAGPRD